MERRGFTLIELILVVIIISILARIALPRYNKSVEHARVAEAKNMLSALRESQLRYTAESDIYAGNADYLDINASIPGRYYTYSIITSPVPNPNDATDDRLAKATRNGQQVGGGYSSNYEVSINESGILFISSGNGPPM